MAKNQNHELQSRKEKEQKAFIDSEFERKAVKIYKTNKWISLAFSFGGYIIYVLVIICVYKN